MVIGLIQGLLKVEMDLWDVSWYQVIISYYLPYYLGPRTWVRGWRTHIGCAAVLILSPTWEMPAGLINSRDLWSTSGWFTAASLSRIYTTTTDRFMEDSTAVVPLPPLFLPHSSSLSLSLLLALLPPIIPTPPCLLFFFLHISPSH